MDEMNKCIHELVSIQHTFKSFEQLAQNGSYRFNPAQFRKAVLKIQKVIDFGREISTKLEEADGSVKVSSNQVG